ncbi:MAG: two-component sensor histidine kinase [Burkholderiales bacterium]|nr:two-component sensor histidine kinase [Burkholderiales bacterium]
MDERIAQLEAELAAARREMQDFSYTVSHDLRAPLRHIAAYAQLVQEDAGPLLSAEVQGFLGTITDAAKHMGVMLDALLELSRVGTAPVQRKPVALQDVLHAVMESLGAQQAQREVRWSIAPNAPVVQADAALLRLALEQVLGNALKFTGPRALAEIAISAELLDGAVRLTVQDNGVGFNPEQSEKLFQPFVRLHSTRQFEGLGMGLALTRKALQRMGGDVAIGAGVDAGCCVTITLPTA